MRLRAVWSNSRGGDSSRSSNRRSSGGGGQREEHSCQGINLTPSWKTAGYGASRRRHPSLISPSLAPPFVFLGQKTSQEPPAVRKPRAMHKPRATRCAQNGANQEPPAVRKPRATRCAQTTSHPWGGHCAPAKSHLLLSAALLTGQLLHVVVEGCREQHRLAVAGRQPQQLPQLQAGHNTAQHSAAGTKPRSGSDQPSCLLKGANNLSTWPTR